ncbi:MAG TPA: NAD(P)H-dependent glycerol-3-phosphate dehydrogenase [Chitinispirillaceae bacterium]|nr:NAD(P)H-dependent glycerol-3-phosphate dehydrogenase [Chitinispirillaceae bacterium]
MNIGILGAGSWAIALSVLLHKKGHQVRMWEFNPKDAEMLRTKREHAVKLPGIIIPDEIEISNDIPSVVNDSEFIVCAVPSQTMRATMKAVQSKVASEKISSIEGWVIVAKGIETGTLKLMTDVITEELPQVPESKLVVLSGPSHAEEVSRNIPTTVVAASSDLSLAEKVQNAFSNDYFRIYTNTDIRGVELAGSVKNVIALAAGICDGLGFGDNTKGALLTRGIVEMMRLGKKMGAEVSTFSGLAGIGDLITTCVSKHSRNRHMGELIASGLNLQDALSKMTMVAEGVDTARSTYNLAQKYDIEMPITREVYKTLFEGKNAKLATRDLMQREAKPEWW